MAVPTFDDRIGQFISVRNRLDEIEKEHKLVTAPLTALKERLEADLLRRLKESGQESAKAASGTAYISVQSSASLADPDAFMRHVIGTQQFDLLDRKANKTAVRDFIKEHGEAPPGVNYSEYEKVGVRKPGAK